ncbi:MAG: GAF domain-containing protein [Nitrososphaerota archaeon]|nr:GAF domain-containing protein [Nitrososphaerota archaeon]
MVRLSREQAKEVLGEVDAAISSSSGRSAREQVVRLLNSLVPSYSWVGIYLADGSELVLDAWSGPAATEHARIPIGKGVCGFAAKAGRTEIVSDVSKDPRYLQCFLSTKSEIVVPILNSGKVVGEIDIDSDQLDSFSSVDREFLEAVGRKVVERWA